jgi:hypothetical protein
MAILKIIAVLIGSASGKIAADEAKAWLPVFSQRVLDVALLRLPSEQRERFREEWTADLLDYPGAVSRVIRALGICCAAWKISLASSNSAGYLRKILADFFGPRFRILQTVPKGKLVVAWVYSLGVGAASGLITHILRSYVPALVASCAALLISSLASYTIGRAIGRRILRQMASGALGSAKKQVGKI